MDFRVGVHRDVALVEVGQNNNFGQRARRFFDLAVSRGHRFFRDQNRDAGALRLIVLTGDVQDVGTNDIDNLCFEDLRQALGVVLFIDVLNA